MLLTQSKMMKMVTRRVKRGGQSFDVLYMITSPYLTEGPQQ